MNRLQVMKEILEAAKSITVNDEALYEELLNGIAQDKFEKHQEAIKAMASEDQNFEIVVERKADGTGLKAFLQEKSAEVIDPDSDETEEVEEESVEDLETTETEAPTEEKKEELETIEETKTDELEEKKTDEADLVSKLNEALSQVTELFTSVREGNEKFASLAVELSDLKKSMSKLEEMQKSLKDNMYKGNRMSKGADSLETKTPLSKKESCIETLSDVFSY